MRTSNRRRYALVVARGVKTTSPHLHSLHELNMKTFRVIIAGGRDFADYSTMESCCDYYLMRRPNVEILSGMARGADTLAVRYANSKSMKLHPYPANWDKWGKRAGHIRNEEMASNADALIAFWDGSSKGTADMIERARKRGLLVRVVMYGPDVSGMW